MHLCFNDFQVPKRTKANMPSFEELYQDMSTVDYEHTVTGFHNVRSAIAVRSLDHVDGEDSDDGIEPGDEVVLVEAGAQAAVRVVNEDVLHSKDRGDDPGSDRDDDRDNGAGETRQSRSGPADKGRRVLKEFIYFGVAAVLCGLSIGLYHCQSHFDMLKKVEAFDERVISRKFYKYFDIAGYNKWYLEQEESRGTPSNCSRTKETCVTIDINVDGSEFFKSSTSPCVRSLVMQSSFFPY